jgi:hypothetical protein
MMTPSEEVAAWEALFANKAWQLLMDTVKVQREERVKEIMMGEHTPENTLQREQIRGEWAGLELVEVYAKTMHDVAVRDLELVIKEQNHVDQKV